MATIALVGGQYGSEGKGVIAAHIADHTDMAIRTGGPNAGHSLQFGGCTWKMRSIPCAWTNPETLLIIGPGAVISPKVLREEANALEAVGYGIRPRLLIDKAAFLIQPQDEENERDIGKSIGSTMEGVGQARIRKVLRGGISWIPAETLKDYGFQVVDTTPLVNAAAYAGASIVLEGTQGFGLSLNFGEWPYVTSADCTAARLIADAGLGRTDNVFPLIVFRSYPIRVGGTSGPMYKETTWKIMAERLGKPGLVERTTVTNRIRRIGEFDWTLSMRAVMINGARGQVLTFADYIDPECEGVTEWSQLTNPVLQFIQRLEKLHGIPVMFVGTGGNAWSVVVNPLYERATMLGGTAGGGKNYDRKAPSHILRH